MTKEEIRQQILNMTTPSLSMEGPIEIAEKIFAFGEDAIPEVIDISRNSTPQGSRVPNQATLIEAIIRFASTGNKKAIDYLHEVADGKVQFARGYHTYSPDYPLSAAKRFFSSQKKVIDQPQEKSVKSDSPTAEKEKLTEFTTSSTKNPDEAVNVLFDKAIFAIPHLSEQQVNSAYQSVQRTWNSQQLIHGSRNYVKEVVLMNARILSQRNDFSDFQVTVLNAAIETIYRNAECAQIMVLTTRGFIPIRVWKTKQGFFTCGNSDFQAPRKKWWEFWKK